MTMGLNPKSPSDDIDTVRGAASPEDARREGPMTTTVLPPAARESSSRRGLVSAGMPLYGAPMTSVTSVITAIDINRPGLSDTKRNLLLFFAQGHYLARGGGALFAEALYATDTGVEVEVDDVAPVDGAEEPSSGALNTINTVLMRYADLSPADLRTLIQASQPWQLARKSSAVPRIEWAWLTDWFTRSEETDDPADDRPTRSQLMAWRARART